LNKIKFTSNLSILMRMLRVKQWVKNILIVVPLFTSQKIQEPIYFNKILLSVFAFCLCSSSVYIINDIIDIKNDRNHPVKKYRPFASGEVSTKIGIIVVPLLLLSCLFLSLKINKNYLILLIIYFFISCIYSIFIKKIKNVDCITLATLYTMRIIAGGYAFNVAISFWLLTFSFFIFLSLAYLKRFAELKYHKGKGLPGRGYSIEDLGIVKTIGVISGIISSAIMSLYANDEFIKDQYLEPQYIWLTVPTIVIWITNMWSIANRGRMQSDPLEYAIKDKLSLVSGVIFVACFILAMRGLPG
jgi:4-hydroxybenzoate polyprenyltransferase